MNTSLDFQTMRQYLQALWLSLSISAASLCSALALAAYASHAHALAVHTLQTQQQQQQALAVQQAREHQQQLQQQLDQAALQRLQSEGWFNSDLTQLSSALSQQLAAQAQALQLEQLRLSIKPTPHALPLGSQHGGDQHVLHLQTSLLSLHMQIWHEGDLVNVLQALQSQHGARLRILSCSMTPASSAPGLQVSCELEWRALLKMKSTT
ncbi:hypothetical protein ED236_08545 [Pseudomethylobacillus aquaticus]|uniref:Uncharacterized protein n=1 Tax=Pseudomethylobacillus aquaticus TaxID=2676064 RepID=A0A3N0UZV1_9PROT|nr:hypothetical protein [Pseudomethylobacillus aquaticus]ROH85781.1 hypothetical protein ED236_08545 [Pseudomethylobacillus aquaticus]